MKKNPSQKEAYRIGIVPQMIEPIALGPTTSYSLLHDPIHLSFVLSRYKFVARMLAGKGNVLEVGCGDAFGVPIVAQFVKQVVAIDMDEQLVISNRERLSQMKNIEFRAMDFCEEIPEGKFDAVYSVDVIEHLDKYLNRPFMEQTVICLVPEGVCLIGTPNSTAQKYASPQSATQHINVQSHTSLRSQLAKYFDNVFLFSMNDEVVHTGFAPMAHYLWGMGVGVRSNH